MGQGEEVKIRSQPNVDILERGEIYFFYRPKVDKEQVSSPEDVQRLYIVLRPESGESSVEIKQESAKEEEGEGHSKEAAARSGGHGTREVDIEKKPLLRLIIMGRKSLPDPSKKGRPFWGFVELVTTNTEDVKTALKGEEYDAATRGQRHNPPARALGEGIYRILRHHTDTGEEGKKKKNKKMHTHLIYKLEFPPEAGAPQESLNVEREGSFLILIKNPNRQSSQFRGLESKRKAAFPAHLQRQFGKLRYHKADPPDFLNYEGSEILLISASDNIEGELGLELKVEVEESGSGSLDASCSDLVKTFGETASTDPLLKGVWV